MDLSQYLSFIVTWLGLMAIIGVALLITQKFRKKDEEKSVDAKQYAEDFEANLQEKTAEKPIKKEFRNPFYLSEDEKNETKRQTEEQN